MRFQLLQNGFVEPLKANANCHSDIYSHVSNSSGFAFQYLVLCTVEESVANTCI